MEYKCDSCKVIKQKSDVILLPCGHIFDFKYISVSARTFHNLENRCPECKRQIDDLGITSLYIRTNEEVFDQEGKEALSDGFHFYISQIYGSPYTQRSKLNPFLQLLFKKLLDLKNQPCSPGLDHDMLLRQNENHVNEIKSLKDQIQSIKIEKDELSAKLNKRIEQHLEAEIEFRKLMYKRLLSADKELSSRSDNST